MVEEVEYFDNKYVEHAYSLRDTLTFHIPLIKSVRLASAPIFSFPFIFNHFPEPFKEIMERKIFNENLEKYYNDNYFETKCKKKLCKICDLAEYKKRQLSYALNFSRYFAYHQYQNV